MSFTERLIDHNNTFYLDGNEYIRSICLERNDVDQQNDHLIGIGSILGKRMFLRSVDDEDSFIYLFRNTFL